PEGGLELLTRLGMLDLDVGVRGAEKTLQVTPTTSCTCGSDTLQDLRASFKSRCVVHHGHEHLQRLGTALPGAPFMPRPVGAHADFDDDEFLLLGRKQAPNPERSREFDGAPEMNAGRGEVRPQSSQGAITRPLCFV